jgi:hypothetical protein
MKWKLRSWPRSRTGMVWTTWYRDRLAGYPRDEKREFAYLQIE